MTSVPSNVAVFAALVLSKFTDTPPEKGCPTERVTLLPEMVESLMSATPAGPRRAMPPPSTLVVLSRTSAFCRVSAHAPEPPVVFTPPTGVGGVVADDGATSRGIGGEAARCDDVDAAPTGVGTVAGHGGAAECGAPGLDSPAARGGAVVVDEAAGEVGGAARGDGEPAAVDGGVALHCQAGAGEGAAGVDEDAASVRGGRAVHHGECVGGEAVAGGHGDQPVEAGAGALERGVVAGDGDGVGDRGQGVLAVSAVGRVRVDAVARECDGAPAGVAVEGGAGVLWAKAAVWVRARWAGEGVRVR
ncbi:hypothetical protein [Streptomyces sp. NPDC086787]|uniref:hypothetical protein n=1 Tax=Streptomyces sp. NPDC086787 TaxID=3365759 RepID=UPI00380B0281